MDEIIAQYTRPIYSFVYRLVRDTAEAEDITQEVFVKVWKNLRKVDPDRNIKAWIFAIARNTVIDYMRKKKAVAFSEFESDGDEFFGNSLPDSEPLAPALFEQAETSEMLEKALADIPLGDRTVIMLHDIEELTFEEIAVVLKKPMNTVKSQYRRALSKLRAVLNAPKL